MTVRRVEALPERIIAIGDELESMRRGASAGGEYDAPPVRPEERIKAEQTPFAPTVVDAVSAVVRRASRPLKPSEIKAKLEQAGFKQTFSDNYFYTVLGRLVEKRVLIKTVDKRFMALSQNGANQPDMEPQ